MLLSIHFPSWLSPQIIPGLPFRWYGLMYVFAFATAYLIYRRQVRERNFPMNDDQLSGLFFVSILSLIVGARIFHALVYEPDGIYIRNPWLIFWPFRDGQFSGLVGMSYHGGVIGGVAAIFIYSKVKKFDFRETGDMFAASIPLGFTFGRLGNFINGELYGRITASPIGMYFPNGGIYPWDSNFELIKETAGEMGLIGIEGPFGSLNFPRHPSQLYQMILEGIVLWAIIWLFRKHKPFKGFLITLYISGYGLFRFIIEYFREPDSAMGYPIDFINANLPTALYHPLFSFSAGQIFSFFMILAGIAWAVFASRLPDNKPQYIYSPDHEKPIKENIDPAERASQRNQRRKMRRKLR